jgi:hypothetical protein
LLGGGEDMGVLCEGAQSKKIKDNDKELGFHSSKTILRDIL